MKGFTKKYRPPKEKRAVSWPRMLLWCGFAVYVLVLIRMLLLRNGFTELNMHELPYYFRLRRRHSLVPFRSIIQYLNMLSWHLELALYNLVGNFMLMMPMGFLLPCLWSGLRTFRKTVLTVFLIVLGVELLQMFLLVGIFDIDDMILNLSGAMIGYALWRLPPMQKLLGVCRLESV